MAPGSDGRGWAGAVQIPICRRVAGTEDRGRYPGPVDKLGRIVRADWPPRAGEMDPVANRVRTPLDFPFSRTAWPFETLTSPVLAIGLPRNRTCEQLSRRLWPVPSRMGIRLDLLGLPQCRERDKTAHWRQWNRSKGRSNGCEFSAPTTT